MLQVALGLVGLVYVAMIYPLYTDLAHSKWLLEMKDACEPMFLSWFITLGPFLLLAARKPSLHRSLITFAACHSLAHASGMTIQTVEAWKHGVHRDFTDVVLFGVIGGILLALTLGKPYLGITSRLLVILPQWATANRERQGALTVSRTTIAGDPFYREWLCGAGQGCRGRILERLYIDNCLPLTVELFRQLAFFILSCKPISYCRFKRIDVYIL